MKTALKQIELKGLPVWDNTKVHHLTQIRRMDTRLFRRLTSRLTNEFFKERFTHMLDVGKAAVPIIARRTDTNKYSRSCAI